MKRKTQLIILLMLLLVFCLGVLVSCQNQKADYFNYSAENLGLVGKLVQLMHGWIGNYGWTVVVFTVFLKVAMLPLDLWQRVSSRKSSLKMQKLQPLMAEIDKRYGANTQRANMEKQKLNKKQGFSAFSMCLPMILSMVIFFVMFGGLRDYSTYSSVTNFQNISDAYIEGYFGAVEGEEYEYLNGEYEKLKAESSETSERAQNDNAHLTAINHLQEKYGFEYCEKYRTAALENVKTVYTQNHESWLWLNNVWQPDTWASIMPAYNDRTNGFSATVDMGGFGRDGGESYYELIRSAVLETGGHGANGSWNGLMILPILSIGLSFLSMFITQWMDKKSRKGQQAAEQSAQQAATNKTMMIMMPLMMAFFGFMYTGAFAIYMVCNYTLSILSTIAMRAPVEKIVEKSLVKEEAKENSGKASYMR